ncbi:hypothetical protein H8A99_03720 [Bradyrhizobium sp. Arg68]|uniref:hypothetical protein n=1 Tax=Bradyrhizobium ivorense TaxID=2511166 RepID=UPI001E50A0ED|nr:hypothetical protein [Bradyrhizobium ivorense]MCC8935625.1 hypothetical protein [Bradyrhizobium ivorense]
MILLKSSVTDKWRKLPLREKLILIFKDRVKNAEDDEDLARAKRDLARIEATPPEENKNGAVD